VGQGGLRPEANRFPESGIPTGSNGHQTDTTVEDVDGPRADEGRRMGGTAFACGTGDLWYTRWPLDGLALGPDDPSPDVLLQC
jgi:hypothetical protein